MCTASKDCSLKLWDTSTGELVCSHLEEESGMWTSVRSYSQEKLKVNEEDRVLSSHVSFEPFLVATSYNGGIFVLTIAANDGGSGASMHSLNMVRPVGEEYDQDNIPHPSDC